jgi:hypothetical protein
VYIIYKKKMKMKKGRKVWKAEKARELADNEDITDLL